MKYLIDTHIFIWWIVDSPKLSKKFKNVITNEDSIIYLSSASTWEIAIKTSIGKLKLPSYHENFIQNQLEINKIKQLKINIKHTFGLLELPMIHKDPFDRILISQAKCEDLTIITNDPLIKKYDVKVFG